MVNREISPMREKYNELMDNKEKIDEILIDGAKRVRPLAQKTLMSVKKAIGVLDA